MKFYVELVSSRPPPHLSYVNECLDFSVMLPRLPNDAPANQILRTCCKAQDGIRPSSDWKRPQGRPPTTWIYQIHRDTGISVTDALELAADRSFWRQVATAGCYGWTLRVM